MSARRISVELPDGALLYNGGQRCDSAVGPCACGAWHTQAETDGRLHDAAVAAAATADLRARLEAAERSANQWEEEANRREANAEHLRAQLAAAQAELADWRGMEQAARGREAHAQRRLARELEARERAEADLHTQEASFVHGRALWIRAEEERNATIASLTAEVKELKERNERLAACMRGEGSWE